MVSNSYSEWGVRLGTLAFWAAAAASLVFWGLRLTAPADGPLAPAVAAAPVALDAQALARLFGAVPVVSDAAPVAPQAAARFALLGVLSGRRSGGGAALIAIGNQPAKPFRVGATVDQELVVQSLGLRQAQLGPRVGGPTTLTLEMPPLRN
ncbi:general secretion pathway protein C [Verminephrobacter aporrectodeae subsp. tuberculatae]|uniref:General secretion pathway protein C n=1 Tax=Verminephrobacter aporrectodeae subsp. tuberculatae TaxID=1110392 RepID=A0ABT3KSW4_9BURK|nr:type II secretion system protein N [Verminephrobacter aporrectodeae]MCW5257447.1 general secretion pathway protein C [Verminephrobacter aporrectodeae subsp. tuberculatae]MCW5321371.1 general secretion pathway protein C [Verminephrobacter aporrectodeae subsp. tuberculatae]MCW8165291.1 general secretion pathway protein C [Verminephrobacter aporrectodeae subsp. tuberculatae]MCW8169427.1 general secretion pathway protein C [Verminephrobacter aporrectodeae subsp. tuberculatae]MCW8207491.1 genera